MRVLNKLTLQNLKLNKKRTIVTVIGIILSGAMIMGVATIVASFQDLFIQSAIETDGNFHATFYDVKIEQKKYLTDHSYTETAILSRDAGFAPFDALPDRGAKPYLFVKEYDTTAFNHLPITLTEGRFPERIGEIVISEEIYERGGEAYAIGQSITLTVGIRILEGEQLRYEPASEEEVLNPLFTETYTITGFTARPRFEFLTGVPGHGAIAYLDESKLTAAELVNVSILGKNPRQIYDNVPQMAEAAGEVGYTYNSELLRWLGISMNENANAMLYSVALIVIVLIVVGSVAVIYNAFAISVSERKKQFGMLASVGATPTQIRRTVFYEGALLGIIGIPVGVLSGIFGIGVTLSVVNELLRGSFSENLSLRLIVSPATILVTVLFVGLVIFLSAYIPAKNASRISPIDAIRLTTDINIKGKKLKTSRLTRFIFGVEGELALKNLKRNRRRYRATVFSLFISIVLFISFTSFMKYGFQTSDMYYDNVPYNVTLAQYDTSLNEQLEFMAQVADMGGINRYSINRSLGAYSLYLDASQFGSFLHQGFLENGILQRDETGKYPMTLYLVAVDEKELETYAEENNIDLTNFRESAGMGAILINKGRFIGSTMVEYAPLQVKTGDLLQIRGYGADEELPPPAFDLKITAVTDTLPFGISEDYRISTSDGIYTPVVLIVSESVLEQLLEPYEHEWDRVNMYIDAADSAALVEEIRNLNKQYPGASLYVQDMAAIQNELKRTTTVISIFLYGFVTLITLIGVTNIFNTISTNIALRSREFAMLKSVGLTPKGFNKIINYESIFYGLKALLYGLPVSIAISFLMHRAFGNMFDFGFTLPWREIAFCIIGVFVIVSITMIHASTKLKKENIIDALKAENL